MLYFPTNIRFNGKKLSKKIYIFILVFFVEKETLKKRELGLLRNPGIPKRDPSSSSAICWNTVSIASYGSLHWVCPDQIQSKCWGWSNLLVKLYPTQPSILHHKHHPPWLGYCRLGLLWAITILQWCTVWILACCWQLRSALRAQLDKVHCKQVFFKVPNKCVSFFLNIWQTILVSQRLWMADFATKKHREYCKKLP